MSQADRGRLSQDVVFDLLSNPRRRFVLSYLSRQSEPVDLIELAKEIAAWENETDVEDLTSQQRKRVYVSIYQTHIPKLEDAGVIEYDREEGVVQLAERGREINEYFEGDETGHPWQRYYLGLALASAVFYALVSFDVAVFALVSELVAGFVIIFAFALVALAHYYETRQTAQEMPTELITRRP